MFPWLFNVCMYGWSDERGEDGYGKEGIGWRLLGLLYAGIGVLGLCRWGSFRVCF